MRTFLSGFFYITALNIFALIAGGFMAVSHISTENNFFYWICSVFSMVVMCFGISRLVDAEVSMRRNVWAEHLKNTHTNYQQLILAMKESNSKTDSKLRGGIYD